MMTHPAQPCDPESPVDRLDRAIGAVHAEASPAEVRGRVLAAAAAWPVESADSMSTPGRRPRFGRLVLVVVGAAAMFACFLLAWASLPGLEPFSRRPQRPSPPGSDARAHVGLVRTQEPPNAFYEPLPVSQPVVSRGAPTLVTTGPDEPIALGTHVGQLQLAHPPHNQARLHVWNWSQSATSRIVRARTAYRNVVPFLSSAAVSPDGQSLFLPNGEWVNLSTGEVQQLTGFETAGRQRVDRLAFAPNGKRVAALLLEAGGQGRMPSWSIRVVAVPEGVVEAVFPADGVDHFAWVAFAPDSQSLFHATARNVIVRRDASTGEILRRYLPAIEPHGAIGIAVSPDGRRVAAAHYHGQLSVWDTMSGELLLQHPFRRSSGEFDPFWQAKVLEFSPDSRLLATASTSRLQIIDGSSGEVIARHEPDMPSHVTHLRWSPDARTITVVSGAGLAQAPDRRQGRVGPGVDILPMVYQWDWRTSRFTRRFGGE
jgi:hypothetical protein